MAQVVPVDSPLSSSIKLSVESVVINATISDIFVMENQGFGEL